MATEQPGRGDDGQPQQTDLDQGQPGPMQTPRRVLITDEQLGYLIRRLDWEAEVRPQASVAELGDFDLLLQTQSAEPSSSDPRSVSIDLCVAADDKTLIERLTANVDRLERSLSSLTADSAAAKD